jgi:hypothetical protein
MLPVAIQEIATDPYDEKDLRYKKNPFDEPNI